VDITIGTPFDGFNDYIVPKPVVFQKPMVINNFIMDYLGKNIGFKLLILRGMTVIKSPLLKWNIFGDKK